MICAGICMLTVALARQYLRYRTEPYKGTVDLRENDQH